MAKKILIAAVIGIAAIAATLFYRSGEQGAAAAFIDASDQQLVSRGKDIYANHCASCHGTQLEGQPDWRQRRADGRLPAPPHDATGHTWHHPDLQLFDIVKNGLVPGRTAPEGYESDMPAYGQTLPDADIIAVLAYIKSTWPADILKAQQEVSAQQTQR